tara:strand:+ start:638 stop:1213 length:576 start_codon:yes stop_codon:yes gene_type:complete
MRPPFQFLVRPQKGVRYDNTKTLGGKEFILSSSQEDHTTTNRFAVVVAVPITYQGEIKKGDTLLVHHNVFRKYYDMKGRERSGPSFFMDDLFLIDYDQFYLYKHGDSWQSADPYCFIKPIDKTQQTLDLHATEQELIGVIRYGNVTLSAKGIKEGDVVSFQPDSEYEFTVDGEKLYRMFTKNICILLDPWK